MIPKDSKKRLYTLEACNDVSADIRKFMINSESGKDNRNIHDHNDSQVLSQKDLETLKEQGTSSVEILSHLVENSKTFNSKTEFAQEKYLKKKEKKYFEYLQIRKPTVRIIADTYFRQDSESILGLRRDTLSQIISYSGINESGNYLLYESGTNGLMPAAVLNSIGAKTKGCLIHMHPGNFAQKQGLQALNFQEEQLNRCVSVNIYSVLRQFHQRNSDIELVIKQNDDSEPPKKILKLDNDCKNGNSEATEEKKTVPKWFFDNEDAIKILDNKVDALIIVSKEHPWSILNTLLPFLKPSRPVIIYNAVKEVLSEIFLDLKAGSRVTAVRLISNWMRNYQVLPNRTHPEVNMESNSGFLLSGILVES